MDGACVLVSIHWHQQGTQEFPEWWESVSVLLFGFHKICIFQFSWGQSPLERPKEKMNILLLTFYHLIQQFFQYLLLWWRNHKVSVLFGNQSAIFGVWSNPLHPTLEGQTLSLCWSISINLSFISLTRCELSFSPFSKDVTLFVTRWKVHLPGRQ